MEEFNYNVNESTRKFIEDDFKERFKRTGNRILLEKPFQKVAEHYVKKNVPAYLRTQNAISTNPEAIKMLQNTLDEFLYKIESREIGWQYSLKKDGQECIKLFDELGENIIEYRYIDSTRRQTITLELQIRNMLNRWMKEIDTDSSENKDVE